MELYEALHQITAIRQQMAKSEVFRGYRSVTVGFSGLLGLFAASIQTEWVAAPTEHLERYLALWFFVAILSIVLVGLELYWRAFCIGSGMMKQMTISAVGQFLPCILIGGLLTTCIFKAAPEVAWMLPGLWSLLFGLGIFSSYRMLPSPICWVGAYYVLCGCGSLMFGQEEYPLSPWQMGISFGGGQFIAAFCLYWTLERDDIVERNDSAERNNAT
ncbi:hypothetical protein Pla110_40520 [Polystyrenella longa]|uniref:Uncharacterized protein n=1 Tax=Polystyrenella longa TaxID=2528007 RepID=A0A518CST7_9PLAN|nr:hypothetical protein [Polystyrenella longa]QDU82297.1 hypothetical protein Pla110_40520 [Polystyrenella longa]